MKKLTNLLGNLETKFIEFTLNILKLNNKPILSSSNFLANKFSKLSTMMVSARSSK